VWTQRSKALAIAAGWLAVALVAGCSAETRSRILPYFFDGFDPADRRPPPPTHRVRRDLLAEIGQLSRELSEARAAARASTGAPIEDVRPPIERAKTWQDAAALLPRDRAGQVDWVQALRAGTVTPRAAVDPRQPPYAPFDLEVELATARSQVFRVRYPHAPHTEWLTCANCHPAIFPLQRNAPPTVITMARIKRGEYCGVCHGRVAFGVEGECARCHAAVPATSTWRPPPTPARPIEAATRWQEAARMLPVTAGVPDWSRARAEGTIAPGRDVIPGAGDPEILDLDVQRVSRDGAKYNVVFPHRAHTELLHCDSCHPYPFAKEAGKTPMSMDLINLGEFCGMCHGKVAFPTDACGRCHPALGDGR
jgi:c(7)-type cytochrome triheme protein